ncbi:hypothetical protein [Streptomyces sp. NPDC088733]|uniref:hypothetical protein n=1 Tax=Streptomyces sp. NPDC088733 TaxID=3365880 RepID=UPI00380AF1E1
MSSPPTLDRGLIERLTAVLEAILAYADFRHYTPEELVDPEGEFRLPTTARMIREWAYQRKFTRSRMGGRVTLRLPHIKELVESFDEPAMQKPKRRT